jgi:hypothetical protein
MNVELWAELVRVELSVVEGLLHHRGAPSVTTGGEAMNVDDKARKEVMCRAIVVIHGNMVGVTWIVVACLPRSCHLCATLATEAVLAALSRLKGMGVGRQPGASLALHLRTAGWTGRPYRAAAHAHDPHVCSCTVRVRSVSYYYTLCIVLTT